MSQDGASADPGCRLDLRQRQHPPRDASPPRAALGSRSASAATYPQHPTSSRRYSSSAASALPSSIPRPWLFTSIMPALWSPLQDAWGNSVASTGAMYSSYHPGALDSADMLGESSSKHMRSASPVRRSYSPTARAVMPPVRQRRVTTTAIGLPRHVQALFSAFGSRDEASASSADPAPALVPHTSKPQPEATKDVNFADTCKRHALRPSPIITQHATRAISALDTDQASLNQQTMSIPTRTPTSLDASSMTPTSSNLSMVPYTPAHAQAQLKLTSIDTTLSTSAAAAPTAVANSTPKTPPLAALGPYRLLQHLGDGTYASVYLSMDTRPGAPIPYVAIKLTRLDQSAARAEAEARARHEASVLADLQNCPGIVRMLDVVQVWDADDDGSNGAAVLATGWFGIVLEWMQGGDLFDWCRGRVQGRALWESQLSMAVVDEKEREAQRRTRSDTWESHARRIFIQLLEAVNAMHERGILNRDLKLENCLLSRDGRTAKICDMGLAIRMPVTASPISGASHTSDERSGRTHEVNFWSATQVPKSPMTAVLRDRFMSPAMLRVLAAAAGSDEYVAPEIVVAPAANAPSSSDTDSSTAASGADGRKSDLWSLGVILYAMLYGRMPFIRRARQTRRSFLFQIASADVRLREGWGVSAAACNVMRCMLRRKQAERASGEVIRSMPWLLADADLARGNSVR